MKNRALQAESEEPSGLFSDLPFLLPLAVGLFVISRYNYVLFHSLVEAAIAAATFSAFAFAWNSRRFEHGYLLLLGLASGFVGALSVLHALAYQGMNVFPENGANFAPQFWLSSRYLMSVVLIIAPFYLKRRLPLLPAATILFVITGLLIFAVLTWRFPTCFVPGQGQTPFKIVSEYVVCALLAIGLGLMLRQRHLFSTPTLRLLVAYFLFSICAGLAFSSYLGMYDFSNMVGHFFLLFATYAFYKAIVETGMRRPFELLFRELRQAIRARDEFLSIASHELKTPLTPLKLQLQGFHRLIRNNPDARIDPAQAARMVEVSTKQIDRLAYLIDNLLDVSRISSGHLSLKPQVVDAGALLREVTRRHAKELEDSGCHLKLATGDEELPVNADPVRLDQVITNLFMNALKYAPSSPLELGAAREFDHTILLWVHDRGPGISREAQERIFERFERASSAVGTSGLGLGLFISRQIVEAHGGSLSLVSAPDFGSRFEVRLKAVAP